MTRLAVISAGITQPSSTRLLADRLTEAVSLAMLSTAALPDAADAADITVEVIEVRALAHDITNNVLTGFASPDLQAALDALSAADGVIVATPVYAAGYSGLFKMLIDVLDPDALRGTPVLLGATGGTARHSLAIDHGLRPLFAYLGALVAPTAVFAATEDWGSDEAGRLDQRIARAGVEFARLVGGGRGRPSIEPFETVTPFELLLAQNSAVPNTVS